MPHENVDTVEGRKKVRVAWCTPASVSADNGFVQMAVVDPELPGDFTEWWVDLDRRGVNTLIARLRKARDAAFGRDE